MTFRQGILTAADRLQCLQIWIAATGLIVMMLVTVADVSLRYLFNRPIRGSYEMVETLLLLFVFNSMAAAFFARRNIVIDILDPVLGPKVTAFLIRIADLLSVICLGVLMWAMIGPGWQVYEYGDLKLELQLPVYVLWLIAFFSLGGTLLCALAVLFALPASAAQEQMR
jgi:TRAP-type transport system small permease protein